MDNKLALTKEQQAELDKQIGHTQETKGSYTKFVLKTKDYSVDYTLFNQYILVEYTPESSTDERVFLVNMSREDFTNLDLSNPEIAEVFLKDLTVSDSRVYDDSSTSDHPDQITYYDYTKEWYNGLATLQAFLKQRGLLEDLRYGG